MRTECCECDRAAVRYWGRWSYCASHIGEVLADEPDAHKCPKCKTEQPPQVMWRGEPCGECKKWRDEERYFSAEQKRRLYLTAEGRCQYCGEALGDDWHAHHIRPWSEGGLTDIRNAMALCVGCHQEIHDGTTSVAEGRSKGM